MWEFCPGLVHAEDDSRFMLKFFSVGMSSVKAVVPLTCALASLFVVIATAAAQDSYLVGVSTVDITPDYPIRLNGFGNRRAESEGAHDGGGWGLA